MAYASRLRDMLESVYGIELNVRNFKKKLDIPDPNDFDPEPFTKEEIRAICDYAHSPKQKLHYMVLKDSAMRVGESVAIRKKHINTTKNPLEITVTASITKTNRTRITYVTRETAPMLINHLKRLNDNDLVFGNNENQQKATDNAEVDFWRLREELKKILPKFAEIYEENGRHKKNIHSLRAFTATQCAEAVDEGFGHGICGHKKYLGQYIRNQEKMAEKYSRAEPNLMIYETIEVVDHKDELKELQMAQLKTQQTIQEIFALQRQQENLKEENAKLQDQLRQAKILLEQS
jgi:integrase